MRVVDTSAWIDIIMGTQTGRRVRPLLPTKDAWVVPTIVQMELAKWIYRELTESNADEIVSMATKCIVVTLDSRLAIAAAEVSRRHRLSTTDAHATAQAMGVDLLTCDAHFRDLPGVTRIEKT